MTWLSSLFFNPSIALMGAGLIAVPLIIHLINRVRYRRVQFAAMEFLLQAEQRNRQRLLIEQLLLLLLRTLIVLALLLLIARLVLDPSQFALFRESRTHHVVLVDDSASTRERRGETTAWAEGLGVIRKLAAEGARRPQTQRLTVLLASRPDKPLLTDRDVNQPLVEELASRLDPVSFKPTHQRVDFLKGIQSASDLLLADKAGVRELHVISDYRSRDWNDQKPLAQAMETLAEADVGIHLIRTTPQAGPNLAITRLDGAVSTAAAGVPLRLTAGITNFGTEVVTDVRASIYDNGVKTPTTVIFDRIEPGTEVLHEVDLQFPSPGYRRVEIRLDADGYPVDNVRHLSVNVSAAIPVLIVDGDPAGDAASYVADALAADPAATGFQTTIDNPDILRRRPLDDYRCIYLLNVGELPPDSLDYLEKYVRRGGALMMALGDSVRSEAFNRVFHREGDGLSPLPLGNAPLEFATDVTSTEPDLKAGKHPAFAILQGDDNPFLDAVHIQKLFEPAVGWEVDDVVRGDNVKTIAKHKSGRPVMLEKPYGAGKVTLLLTTAQPAWNDWALNPSYVVFQLDLLKSLISSDKNEALRVTGEPILLSLDPALYTDQVELSIPDIDGQRTVRLQASPQDGQTSASSKPKGTEASASTRPDTTPASQQNSASNQNSTVGIRLVVEEKETDLPGIYSVRLTTQNQTTEEKLYAYNVPLEESQLAVITVDSLRKTMGNNEKLSIHEAQDVSWIEGEEAGSELRTSLLAALVILLLAEQWLSYRLSYHPAKGQVAR
ncbi:hypothetical protein Spb1_26480 [Planctopirus ephydatiae]|uniref:Aerotolerance regulator N-terminal domain-containing protein n=1 Tax=Planctopirus ephydatiae TaxID=2528019 RepID=A0A518GQ98_9PLAN|nr:BatA domain-containing protein [Planctopirus ephydatiae]QDV30714.1 hypothetical protein Spb1_26480 [Planctopirus ephydatiae]